MGTPVEEENGIVAVLDALGTSIYSEDKINHFRRSREIVLNLLRKKVDSLQLKEEAVTTFTFNDTVVIVLRAGNQTVTIKHITQFFLLLRQFMVHSLAKRIMFRGAVAEGKFCADDKAHIIMGPAVTDAVAWYDKADWIGIHVTPRTNLVILRRLETVNTPKEHLMIDYDVPLRKRQPGHLPHRVLQVKTVNWPKGFFVDGITPCKDDERPRSALLRLLTVHEIPKGTENKYTNTLAFFDHAAGLVVAKKTRPQKR